MSDEQTPGEDNGDDVIREITYKQRATREEAPATEALHAQLRDVSAETVMMNRSQSEKVTGDRVVMDRSGAKTIDAKSAQLDRSGAVALGADNAVLLHSGAVQVVSEEARLNRSRVIFLSSPKAEIENSRIVLFAGSAEGEVQTMFTPLTAGVAGAAFAIALLLLGGLARGLFGRK